MTDFAARKAPMTETRLSSTFSPQDEREDGFTLIEILVVIIIIGILAAVAIPIFLSQQRTARDSATISDVRNLAASTETGLAAEPEASKFTLYKDEEGKNSLIPEETEELETLYLGVGDATPMKVSKTQGVQLDIEPGEASSTYVIMGWNDDGREHKKQSPLVYESELGGIVEDSERTSTKTGTNSSFENGLEVWKFEEGLTELDKTQSYTGKASVKMKAPSTGVNALGAKVTERHPLVEGGDTWYVTAWVKTEGTTNGVPVGKLGYSSGTAGSAMTVNLPAPGTGWTKISRTYAFGSTSSRVGSNIAPKFELPATSGELTVWVDDLTISKNR